jgi:hypothetical protein
LGLVYSFLRKAGLDEGEARAEFEQFLSGTLSERMLDTATRWIQAERGWVSFSVSKEYAPLDDFS